MINHAGVAVIAFLAGCITGGMVEQRKMEHKAMESPDVSAAVFHYCEYGAQIKHKGKVYYAVCFPDKMGK